MRVEIVMRRRYSPKVVSADAQRSIRTGTRQALPFKSKELKIMAGDPNLIFPFNHTGVFTIGTGQPGAVTLKAILTVPHNSSTVSGHGTLTQATNPPLHSNTAFHGVVHALGLGPAKQVYALTGIPVPPALATTYVMHLSIVLDGIWGTKGTATYSYLVGHHPPGHPPVHEVKDAPVTVQWLLQE
jgi:Domain of unknown function (DUF1842)